MSRIVVLFNLKPGVTVEDYEAWARSMDLPTVNGLESIDSFTVHRVSGLLMSDDSPPYQYVEVIDVNDMDTFGAEVASETMQRVASEFQAFADAPCFLMTEAV